jgi:PAS domain-containing protein
MELASSKLVTSRHEFFTLVHSEDQPRLLETLQTNLREQTPYILEFRLCCPDGVTRWMEAHGRPRLNTAGKPTYLSGVIMDITARKQAEEALARESRERRRVEEQYRFVTAAANDAVYQVDPEGCIAFATPALARLTGYTMKELLGRPSDEENTSALLSR